MTEREFYERTELVITAFDTESVIVTSGLLPYSDPSGGGGGGGGSSDDLLEDLYERILW